MKKLMKEGTAFLLAAMVVSATGHTAFAATAQEIIGKNPASYTAGTQSVYGPRLTQDQLNAVAGLVADFKTNHTNESMTNDQKIRAGYDYVKNRVSYIDWDQGVGANTAYALVAGQGACSGMTRGFLALMDAVEVEAYLVHADTNDHQWILAEFDDGFAFIDIDANVSAGYEIIYHAKTHPYTYHTAGLPAVGSHSSGYGAKTAPTEGWKQDSAGWWYQNADGTYPANAWRSVNDKWYYFDLNGYMASNLWIGGTYYVGSDGAMLAETTTPDGYQVGADGAWVQSQAVFDHTKIYRADQPETRLVEIYGDGSEIIKTEEHAGVLCNVIPDSINTVTFLSEKSNMDASNHFISIIGFMETPYGLFALAPDGKPIEYDFEYDQPFSLDFSGHLNTAEALSAYCKANNVIIKIEIGLKSANNGIGQVAYVYYSNE